MDGSDPSPLASSPAGILFSHPTTQGLLDEMTSPSSFTSQLFDGSLPTEKFQAYILQDQWFLFHFNRAYARALMLADDESAQQKFYGLIGGVLRELQLHKNLCSEWGMDLTQGHQPSPAAQAYIDFLTSLHSSESIDELVAGIVPCMRLYAFLGQHYMQAGKATPHVKYQAWFKEYSSQGMEALAQSIESQLSKISPTVEANYLKAMELERDFFEQHA